MRSRTLQTPLPSEAHRQGRLRMPQGRSSSSVPVHIRFFLLPDKFRPSENLTDADCSIKLPLPEYIRGSETIFAIYPKTSYPIPTHSRHNLTALLSTVTASPRKTPKHSIAIPTTKSAVCAVAFFQCINYITLSFFVLKQTLFLHSGQIPSNTALCLNTL